MGMENLLSSEISTGTTTSESTLRRKGISLTTAKRWLGKLGWIYSRDGKGYVDGHEREDVVQYRETVFIPHWLVRTSIYY
jgi:predicted transcriptional regulator